MTILDGIADAVVKLDRQATYLAMNRAAVEIFRRLARDPEEMIGKTVWQIFPEVIGTKIERELKRALSEQVPIAFETYFPADQRWYETQGYATEEGVLLIFRDITTRKSTAV